MRKKDLMMGFAMAMATKLAKKFMTSDYLNDKVVLITGGSKGLGSILAELLIKEGSKVAICARSEEELKNAKAHLEKSGAEIYTQVCDVSVRDDVILLIDHVITHFGQLDMIINNAGIIEVAPMESFSHEDYESAMDIMYWGIANTTLTVVPYFRKRKKGHIVNITSIGGKVAVPHLLPYSAAKFAAVGFSQGSASELRKDNIYITTIVPWLMRTGSYVNAYFQKGNKEEFKLFSFMSTAPLLTIDAERAAKKIIAAIKAKKVQKVVGIQARVAMEVDHFLPELTTKLFGIVSRIIPASHRLTQFEQGKEITEREPHAELPGLRQIGRKARREHQDLR
jgi:short-subunit dehydrogenase